MKVITIALGVFIPIYIHTHNGLRGIDRRYVELAETVGPQSRLGIRPQGRAARRAARASCSACGSRSPARWLALVVVEQINATSGIGYMMTLAQTYGQTDVIVVGLVVYGVLGPAVRRRRATRRRGGRCHGDARWTS